MSDSPYQPPLTSGHSDDDPSRQEARAVATYQRYVLFAVLASIGANILYMVAGQMSSAAAIAAIILLVGVGIFSMVSIFLLARQLMGIVAGVICTILMLVPCISLITLLVVNQKATSFLQLKGIKVGLMGVNPNTI